MEQIKNNSLVSIKDSDEHGRIIDIEEGFATVKMNGYQKIFPITMLSVVDYEHGGYMEEDELTEEENTAKLDEYADGGITKTKAFKDWFRDSKVVDSKGKPKIMYHGTRSDFTEFKRYQDRYTNHPSRLLGFFFGDYRLASGFTSMKPSERDDIDTIKEDYYRIRKAELGISHLSRWSFDKGGSIDKEQQAKHRRDSKIYDELDKEWSRVGLRNKFGVDFGKGAKIMPVYLSIQNPYEMGFQQILDLGEGKDYSEKLQLRNDKKASDLRTKLIIEGYDGIRILPSKISSESKYVQYVAFFPTQIKSAIANVGTFDRGNPDIRFADGGEIDWGGDLGDGFTIGTDVYITDPKSLYKGKTGFVIATVGNDLLVTVSVDGIDRNCIVNKKRVQKIDAPMAKGGKIYVNLKMASGGKFSQGVKAIEKNLVGKKVPSKYQSKYGKKYNKAEAHEAATRIKGAIVAKERILNALKRKRK